MSALNIGSLLARLQIVGGEQFQQGIYGAQRSLDLTRQTSAKTTEAIGRTEAALSKAGRESLIAGDRSARLKASQLSLIAAQERYNTLLKDQTVSAGRLASAEASLVRAQESVRRATDAAGASPGATRLRNTWSEVLSLAGKFGVAAGGIELAMQGIEKVKAGQAFAQQMLQIQTQAGASAAEVEHMRGEILALAGDVATAPLALANSLYHIESTGLRGAKALEAVKIAAQGAKIGNSDLEQTTNALTATVASGVKGTESMAQAMGTLNTIVGAGDMKLSDLNDALAGGLLSTAKAFGVSIAEVGAGLGVFGDNNIRGAAAGTKLMMVMKDMAQPAATADDALAQIGMTTTQLRESLEKQGLNGALQLLTANLQKAGITGAKLGPFLTRVFSKESGTAISVLLGDMDRWNDKLEANAKGAGDFGAAWEAQSKTAAYAWQTVTAKIEAGATTIYDKAQPALYELGKFLGETLPDEIGQTKNSLEPLIDLVGDGLGAAWTVAGGAIKIAGTAIGELNDFLADHKDLVTGAGTAVAGMWLTFKGVSAVTTAKKSLDAFLDGIPGRASQARASIAGMFTPANAAVGGLGVALGVAGYAWARHLEHVADNRAEIQSLTAAIREDGGVLGEHARAVLADTLAGEGWYDVAQQAGISAKQLTDTLLGQGESVDSLRARLEALGVQYRRDDQGLAATAAGKLSKELENQDGVLTSAVRHAQQKADATDEDTEATDRNTGAAKDNAAAQRWVIDKHGSLIYTSKNVGQALEEVTDGMVEQKTAAELLKDQIDKLNGVNLSYEEAQNRAAAAELDFIKAYKDAYDEKTKRWEEGAHSIDRETEAGLRNRENIVGWIADITAQAEAYAAQREAAVGREQAVKEANAKLKADEEHLVEVISTQTGIGKEAVRTLIADIGKVGLVKVEAPKIPTPDTKDARTAIQKLRAEIANLVKEWGALGYILTEGLPGAPTNPANSTKTVPGLPSLLSLISDPSTSTPPGGQSRTHAAGGILALGKNKVGEKGWEILDNQSKRVYTHEQSKVMEQTGSLGGHGGRIHIEKLIEVNNPVPEPVSVSTPAAMRAAANVLGA